MSNESEKDEAKRTLEECTEEERQKLLKEIREVFRTRFTPKTKNILKRLKEMASDEKLVEELSEKILKDHTNK